MDWWLRLVQVADCRAHRNEHPCTSGRLLRTQKWTSWRKWQTAAHTEMNILVQVADCCAHRNEHPCASGRLLRTHRRTSTFCKMQAVLCFTQCCQLFAVSHTGKVGAAQCSHLYHTAATQKFKGEIKCQFKIRTSVGRVTAGHPQTRSFDDTNTLLSPHRTKTVYTSAVTGTCGLQTKRRLHRAATHEQYTHCLKH
jgi:hypothetical protein